jgi:Domain of unknown function (DUF4160)
VAAGEPDRKVAGKSESWENHSVSPTVLQSGPYRRFFFSSDRGEPVHVHVTRERKATKSWLAPVGLEYNNGFAAIELNKVEGIVREHEAQLIQAWHDIQRWQSHAGQNCSV